MCSAPRRGILFSRYPIMKRSTCLRFALISLALSTPIAVSVVACSSSDSNTPPNDKDSSASGEASTDDATSDAPQGRCPSPVMRAGHRLGGSVALMLDGTGSMLEGTRYKSMASGVIDALTSFELRKDPAFTLTAHVFAGTINPVSPFSVSAPALLDAALIKTVGDALQNDAPNGPSDVLGALVGGSAAITASAPVNAGGSRNVILLFDNINAGLADLTKAASDLAKRSPDPVRTFVVGLPSNAVDYQVMAAVAAAGDTATGGCHLTATSPPFCFEASASKDATEIKEVSKALGRVFEEIACRVELDNVDYDGGLSILDGGPDAAFVVPPLSDAGTKGAVLTWKNGATTETVPYDGINGWTYGPRGRVQLHGQACKDVVTRTELSVEECPE